MAVSPEQVREKNVGKSTISWLPINNDQMTPESILDSWIKSKFYFVEENSDFDIKGLRPPQLGGIFAALGYERTDDSNAATIVMPTGTGKTETILSIVVAGKFKKTLVIVPSDALREQTKNKFIKLGLLRELGLISDSIQNPIVSTIKHGIDNLKDLLDILNSNVIIATAASLSIFKDELFEKLTNECTHLIVDEAHHVKAKTWDKIKSQFKEKSVYQFTATPFREDGSRVEGKIIFNYPLKKAQGEGYFKSIEFHPVREFIEDKADRAIADKAISLIRKDLDAGLDHIMMARVSTRKRAEEIYKIYSSEKDLNPVLIDSSTKNKSSVLESIREGRHKVIVCVNMLGEGFDLPQLKISAIHDPHKSINVMLQFTGRFTRASENVGDAKFIANIANPNVNDCLEELYREDSDWNNIISDISSEKINSEKEYQRFRESFSSSSKLLDLGLNPSLSTTVFKMAIANWRPKDFEIFGRNHFKIVDSIINDDQTILIFSVKSYLPVGWSTSKELFDESWDLYVAFYSKEQGLLFIHSSAKDGHVKKLANIIAKGSSQVNRDFVFRSFSGLKRLKLQNVGLNKNKKGLRYSMHTGTDINDQIPDIEANRSIKSNMFGKGYENGSLASVGCSYKGKIWSMDSGSLDQWVAWCKNIGEKILDDSIDTNEVMKSAMRAEYLDEFPDIPVLSVDWPVEILRKNESKVLIKSAFWEESILNCELLFDRQSAATSKEIKLILKVQDRTSNILMTVLGDGVVKFKSYDNIFIEISGCSLSLEDFFEENPPVLFLSDTSILDGGLRYYSSEGYTYKYDVNNLEDWSWDGVDISVESQTVEKLRHSIQYATIEKIKSNYDLIFDDDGSGEVADIVAIKNNDMKMTIDLYHCKYCERKNGVSKPGARIDDVYEVVGQAQKSIKWFGDKEKLINRLLEREKIRLSKGESSRIDKGNIDDLIKLSRISRHSEFQIGVIVVQPAISKSKISDDQLTLIGAAAAYIDEISGIKLRVVTSK